MPDIQSSAHQFFYCAIILPLTTMLVAVALMLPLWFGAKWIFRGLFRRPM